MWQGWGSLEQSLETESFDSGVKETDVKATPRSHLARAGPEEGEPVAGSAPGTWWRLIGPMFTAQQRCCNRKRGGEGGGSSGGNNLSGARGTAGEEASFATFQGQVECEEGMPSARAASSLCLWLPIPRSLWPQNSVPLSSPRARPLVSQPQASLGLSMVLPFSAGWLTNCKVYLLPRVKCPPTLCQALHSPFI